MKLAPIMNCSECPFFRLYLTKVIECLLQEKNDCPVQIFYGHSSLEEELEVLESTCPLVDTDELLIYDCREIYDKIIKNMETMI